MNSMFSFWGTSRHTFFLLPLFFGLEPAPLRLVVLCLLPLFQEPLCCVDLGATAKEYLPWNLHLTIYNVAVTGSHCRKCLGLWWSVCRQRISEGLMWCAYRVTLATRALRTASPGLPTVASLSPQPPAAELHIHLSPFSQFCPEISRWHLEGREQIFLNKSEAYVADERKVDMYLVT